MLTCNSPSPRRAADGLDILHSLNTIYIYQRSRKIDSGFDQRPVLCFRLAQRRSLDVAHGHHALTRQQARDPGSVPEIYHYDESQALIVMEFLSPHVILRRALIEGRPAFFVALDQDRVAGFATYGHVMQGTGHGIAPDGLGVALQFIRERLGIGK